MSLGYYGNGTTIVITNNNNKSTVGENEDSIIDSNNNEIYKDTSLGKVSYDDIIQDGITAIP
jgi:hypothetical protein